MPRHGMDDVRLTFLQDIFEAVSSLLHLSSYPALQRTPARPDFYADNPVNSRSLSIFYVDLYSSALLRPPLLLCGKQRKETSPTGNMGKTKKKPPSRRSGMIYGLGPSLEGEENKPPESEPNTPNIPFTTPVGLRVGSSADNAARGEIGLSLMSCKRLRPRRNGLVKMSRESRGEGGAERGGHANIFLR